MSDTINIKLDMLNDSISKLLSATDISEFLKYYDLCRWYLGDIYYLKIQDFRDK